jgi:hypothetical protein
VEGPGEVEGPGTVFRAVTLSLQRSAAVFGSMNRPGEAEGPVAGGGGGPWSGFDGWPSLRVQRFARARGAMSMHDTVVGLGGKHHPQANIIRRTPSNHDLASARTFNGHDAFHDAHDPHHVHVSHHTAISGVPDDSAPLSPGAAVLLLYGTLVGAVGRPAGLAGCTIL